jgi:hypothetical protein
MQVQVQVQVRDSSFLRDNPENSRCWLVKMGLSLTSERRREAKDNRREEGRREEQRESEERMSVPASSVQR